MQIIWFLCDYFGAEQLGTNKQPSITAREVGEETETSGEAETEEQMGGKMRRGGQGSPFKREHSKCTQKMLLVAAAKDVSCQDLKGRPVQMPDYWHIVLPEFLSSVLITQARWLRTRAPVFCFGLHEHLHSHENPYVAVYKHSWKCSIVECWLSMYRILDLVPSTTYGSTQLSQKLDKCRNFVQLFTGY